MRNKIDNEKGLTLIELLASITILSIVILTFLAFFTNAFRFNTINSDSIQAMNIAREQQASVKELIKGLQDTSTTQISNTQIATVIQSQGYTLKPAQPDIPDMDVYTKELNDLGYQLTISINKNYENINSYRELHLVHVEVSKNEKPISETYTYYEGNVRSNP